MEKIDTNSFKKNQSEKNMDSTKKYIEILEKIDRGKINSGKKYVDIVEKNSGKKYSRKNIKIVEKKNILKYN